jgi:hypothetical protein
MSSAFTESVVEVPPSNGQRLSVGTSPNAEIATAAGNRDCQPRTALFLTLPWRERVARLDEATLRPSERGGVTVYLRRRCFIGSTSASPEPGAHQQGAHKGRP